MILPRHVTGVLHRLPQPLTFSHHASSLEESRAHLLGLNSCLAHLRSTLGDRARAPRYIETLPRRGYRFIAPVERTRLFPQPTIAVLPFTNLGGDPSLAYFADGMTDALITELACISGLRVISRQTVFQLSPRTCRARLP